MVDDTATMRMIVQSLCWVGSIVASMKPLMATRHLSLSRRKTICGDHHRQFTCHASTVWELCRRVRNELKFKNLPIFGDDHGLLTTTRLKRYSRPAPTDFINKPINELELQSRGASHSRTAGGGKKKLYQAKAQALLANERKSPLAGQGQS